MVIIVKFSVQQTVLKISITNSIEWYFIFMCLIMGLCTMDGIIDTLRYYLVLKKLLL